MAGAVTVDVQALELGRTLDFPIHSCSGVLLLGPGLEFTESFRASLLKRGICQVLLNEADAARVNPTTNSRSAEDPQLQLLETSLNQRIDDFLRQHGVQFKRSGPAVAERVVKHGAAGYSRSQQTAVREAQVKCLAAVDSLMEEAGRDVEMNTDSADRGTNTLMDLLVADFSCTLSTSFQSSGQNQLSLHAIKLSTLGVAIGIEMDLDFDQVRTIGFAGMVADLGMAMVPATILGAARRLSRSEILEVQKHVIRTADLLERLTEVPAVVKFVAYQIHEKPDGSGYPRGRTLSSIHPIARILHTADAYAALTADRPDRVRMSGYAAMELLIRQSQAKKQDPAVVRGLLRCLSLCPIGSYVALSDNSVARVLRANGDQFTQPVVRILATPEGERLAESDSAVNLDLTQSDLRIKTALQPPKSRESLIDARQPVDTTIAAI